MATKTKSSRKTKWVAWFNNKTDRQDDEWAVVYARDYDEAYKLAIQKMDSWRFGFSYVQRINEFRKTHGRGFPV